MTIEIPKEKWTGNVREVTIGATAEGLKHAEPQRRCRERTATMRPRPTFSTGASLQANGT